MSSINAIVLWETGAGKSTFFNSITKNYGNEHDKLLNTSIDTDGCIKCMYPVNFFYNGTLFCFFLI